MVAGNLLTLFKKVDTTFLVFNGTSTQVNYGSGASIDNLHDGEFTIETWVYTRAAASQSIFSKGYNGSANGWA